MKIGIFGPASQLGSDLHIQLPTADPIFKSKVNFLNPIGADGIQRALGGGAWDYLINCAALTDVDYCEKNPAEALSVNANAVLEIARYCEAKKIHLVHISTDFVFDGLAGPYKSTDAPNPINIYGSTKLEAENFIKSAMPSGRYTIIRTSSLFGAARGRKNFIEKMIDAGIKKSEVKANNWRIFSPTSTKSLAERIAKSLLNNDIPKGIIHSVCAGHGTQTEVANFVFQTIPSMSHVKVVGSDTQTSKPPRPPDSRLVSTGGWELPLWRGEIAEYLLQKGYSRPPCVLEVEADAPYAVSKIWEKLGRKQPDYVALVAALREDRTNFLLGNKPKKDTKKSLSDIFGPEL